MEVGSGAPSAADRGADGAVQCEVVLKLSAVFPVLEVADREAFLALSCDVGPSAHHAAPLENGSASDFMARLARGAAVLRPEACEPVGCAGVTPIVQC